MTNPDDYQPTQGTTDYLAKIRAFIILVASTVNEVIAARGVSVDLSAKLATFIIASSGLTQNLNANGYRFTNAADPRYPQDLATQAYVHSIVTAGGSPSSIPVTSLNYGALADGQVVMRSGTGLVGMTMTITNLPYGTLLDGQLLQRSGSGLVGYTPITYMQRRRQSATWWS